MLLLYATLIVVVVVTTIIIKVLYFAPPTYGPEYATATNNVPDPLTFFSLNTLLSNLPLPHP